jgi:hypothetical protein
MQKQNLIQSKDFQIKLYTVLTVVLLLIIGYYSFTNVTKLLDMRSQIAVNEKLHNALLESDTTAGDELKTLKEEGQSLDQKIQDELNMVLPNTENHTTLTRALEKLETDLNRAKNPFNITNLQYLDAEVVEGADYRVLPVKATIQSTYSNFIKFLEYTENSGALSDGTRLLDIKSIIINFVSPKGTENNTSGQDEINFNVSMEAYIRSQKIWFPKNFNNYRIRF